VIAPLLGGINYGPKRHKGTREECYCILGIWFADRYGDPAFSREASGVVAHEFDHSYVNPVVERHLRELRPAAETLFPRVAGKLRRQAYGPWEAMVIESLVRAAQARYVRDVRGQLWGMKAIKEEEGNGFIWTAASSPSSTITRRNARNTRPTKASCRASSLSSTRRRRNRRPRPTSCGRPSWRWSRPTGRSTSTRRSPSCA
jgi:hypothetical protein